VTFNRKVVATLNVADGTPSSANPFQSDGSSWPSARPNYLRDLSQETDWQPYEIVMTASQLNGVTYSATTPLLTRAYDTLQEWTIKSSRAHPYHLHVYHMQVKVGGCGGDSASHEEGEYYDVITVNNDCVVQFHMIDFGGSVMMHCHVLSHENTGSMGWMDVTGGPVQSSTDREQITCPGAPWEPEPTSEPNPATSEPTDSPVAVPTGSCAQTGDRCGADSDCCSADSGGSCSNGSPNSRQCLAGDGTLGPSVSPSKKPTNVPTNEPTDSPTPAPTKACVNVGQPCTSNSICCSESCSNGPRNSKECLSSRFLRG